MKKGIIVTVAAMSLFISLAFNGVYAQDAEQALKNGENYFYDGKYDQATTELSKAVIMLTSRLASAYYYRALSFKKLGDMQRYKDDYEQAVKLDPSIKRVE